MLKLKSRCSLLNSSLFLFILLLATLVNSQSKSISEQIEQHKNSIVFLQIESIDPTTSAISETEATGFVLCTSSYVLTTKAPVNELREKGYTEDTVIKGSVIINEEISKRKLEIIKESNDLLLLAFKGEAPQNIFPVVLSNDIMPKAEDKLHSLGFPTLGVSDLTYKEGTISGNSLPTGNWLLDTFLNKSDRGSPIFNNFWQVIAVVKDQSNEVNHLNEVVPISFASNLLAGIPCDEIDYKTSTSPVTNQDFTAKLNKLEVMIRQKANKDPAFLEQIPQVREEYFTDLRATLLRLLQSNSANVEKALELFTQGNTTASLEKLEVYVQTLEEEQRRASQEASQAYLGLALLDTFTRPDKSLENLQRAVSLYSENLRALNQLGALQIRLDKPYEAIGSFERISKLAGQQGDKDWQANALGNLGIAYSNLGQYQQAISYYDQALAITRVTGDRLGESNNLGNLGLAYLKLTEYQKAINYHEQALEIAREIGDRLGEGSNLGNLGLAHLNLSQYQQAISHFEQALEIAREVRDKSEESNNLGNLGLAYLNVGQYQQSINYYEQALKTSQELGDKLRESSHLGNLGVAYVNMTQYQQAINYYEQALVIAKELGDRLREGMNLSNLGITYLNLGQYQQAINYYEQALKVSQELRDKLGEGSSLGNLGLAYLNLGQYKEAIGYFEQAITIAKEVGNQQEEGSNLGNLGVVYLNLGENSKAESHFKQSLVILEEINSPHTEFFKDKLKQLKGE